MLNFSVKYDSQTVTQEVTLPPSQLAIHVHAPPTMPGR